MQNGNKNELPTDTRLSVRYKKFKQGKQYNEVKRKRQDSPNRRRPQYAAVMGVT